MEHKLEDGTLKAKQYGVVARCTCGWVSTHSSSLAASAAFMDHKDECKGKDKSND